MTIELRLFVHFTIVDTNSGNIFAFSVESVLKFVHIEYISGLFGAGMRQIDREKFVRLANKRVSNALKSIQLIGNLSNKSNYDYTKEDVEKILKALQDELNICRKRFEMASKSRGNVQFSLE